jgi:hypothetical protein
MEIRRSYLFVSLNPRVHPLLMGWAISYPRKVVITYTQINRHRYKQNGWDRELHGQETRITQCLVSCTARDEFCGLISFCTFSIPQMFGESTATVWPTLAECLWRQRCPKEGTSQAQLIGAVWGRSLDLHSEKHWLMYQGLQRENDSICLSSTSKL